MDVLKPNKRAGFTATCVASVYKIPVLLVQCVTRFLKETVEKSLKAQ